MGKRQENAEMVRGARQKQLKATELRKERLASKFADDQVDEKIYRSQLSRIEDELALVVADHHVEVMEEAELRGVLDFAEHVITRRARAWVEFSPDQRRRFQNIVFPDGLEFDRIEGFGTPVT